MHHKEAIVHAVNAAFPTIFTSGTITGASHNPKWTQNIWLEWNEALEAYVVTKTAFGGGSFADYTLKEGEIIIAVHHDSAVAEMNQKLAKAAKVGDILVLNGIDIEKLSTDIGAYFYFEAGFKPGDVNMDGALTATDYLMVRRAVLGLIELDDYQKKLADVNGNGKIDANDYIMVKRAFLGTYTIKGEGNAKYVEVSSADFSEYAVEPTDAFTVAYGTLEIGPANNLADVIECNEMLSSLLVWSDPTGQPVVTVNGDFVITENFIINSEYPVVFDLNGKTLTVAEGVTLSVGSNVQITGEGELVGNVKITNSESDVLNVGSNVNVDALTVVDSNGDEMIKDENGSFIPAPTYVAFVGTQGYETLAAAIAALQDGDTLVICAEEISEGSIKLPASLNNVTIKSENSSVLKNMTITAADGSSVNYNGLTIDGIVFDNSNLVFTGWRTGSVVYSNITISNCTFKNIVRSNNEAAIHFNCDATEAVENIVITKNVINGVSGGSNSGLYLQATGNVTVTDNVINNVAFRPYVIQITTDDGNAEKQTHHSIVGADQDASEQHPENIAYEFHITQVSTRCRPWCP